jgi:DNA helicase HerA-like ATPase
MSIIYVCGKKGYGKTELTKTKIIPKYNRVVILDSLGFEYPFLSSNTISEFGENIEKNVQRDNFVLTYNPLDNHEAEFFKICLVLSDCLIVIEEADLFCTTAQIDDSLNRLIRYGRHRNLDLVLISRRPAEVHRNVTAQSDIIISFRQTEPRDLEYFKKISENWESLKELKKWKYGSKMVKNVHFVCILENDDLEKFINI